MNICVCLHLEVMNIGFYFNCRWVMEYEAAPAQKRKAKDTQCLELKGHGTQIQELVHFIFRFAWNLE